MLIFSRRKRIEDVNRNLPHILDLLSLSVEAGLDFMSAIRRIVLRSRRSLVVDEFARMLNQMKLGQTRSDSLLVLRQRLTHPAVDSFVGMLLQADRLGISIAPVLKSQAEKLRSDRFQRAERAGMIAAEKLLIPLIFCIMPAVFVFVFGPLLVMWKNGTFARMF